MRTPGQICSHAGLRGIAALLVVAYHLQFDSTHLVIEEITPFFRRGYLLVDLFFVLSGFIISYVNRAERERRFTGGEYREFLLRRLIRLYPLVAFTLSYLLLYALLLTAGAVLTGRATHWPWTTASIGTLVEQYLLLNAWLPSGDYWNIASWSISAEMGAYAIFPLLVSLRAQAPRLALALLAAIPLAYYAWIAATTGSLDIINLGSPLRCIAGFALGMLGFYGRERVAAWPVAVLGTIQLLAFVGIGVVLATPSNDVLAIPLFFALVTTSWTDRGIVARAVGSRPMRYLGEISYSVYLNHLCVLVIINTSLWPVIVRLLPALDDDPARVVKIVLTYGLVLAVSHMTFRLVEDRSRRWLTPRLIRHRVRSIEASPAAP